MRKPRDFDAELKVLNERARQLKDRRIIQLGELVAATGADAMPVEVLAGALLSAAEIKDAATVEAWRRRGAAFFLWAERKKRRGTPQESGGYATHNGGA